MTNVTATTPEAAETEWVPFPGGELEGRRPRVLCGACRAQLHRVAAGAAAASVAGSGRRSQPAPLCFACYRASLARDLALKAAGELDTASEARFQSILPLEPIDHARLSRLRAERATARAAGQSGGQSGAGQYVDRRRRAQIAARHALEQIGAGLRKRSLAAPIGATTRRDANPPDDAARFAWAGGGARRGGMNVEWSAFHAVELQFPEAWLPFVSAR